MSKTGIAPFPGRPIHTAAVAVDCALDLLRQAEQVLVALPREVNTFTARDWLRAALLTTERTHNELCALALTEEPR